MNKQIAVVTGGAGFIGSHMVDLLLAKDFEVRVIDDLSGGREENLKHHGHHPDLKLEIMDIRALKPDSLVFKNATYVFHFAGRGDIVPSIEQPTEYMSVNSQGTVHVLECARLAQVKKLVYAASSSCYGLATQVPTPEDAPIQPMYPYALSKNMGEQAVLHWGQLYKLPVNSIRIFNAYGPRSRTSGAYGAVFGVFLRQKIAQVPMTVVGDGTQKRDFIYATDLARAFFLAATTSLSNEIFNVGAGNPQTINRLVELLGGKPSYIPRRPGEPDCTWADITKIKNLLGWHPEVSFEEGVARMVESIEYWKNAPLWDDRSINEATKNWFKFLK